MSDDHQLWSFDGRPSDSPFVDTIWRSQSARAGTFLSVAAMYWELVIMRCQGQLTITVRGPETQASPADCPADGEWLGITFKLGTFMPHLPTCRLVDGALNLPAAAAQSFWLHGSTWELPTYENADTFVARLVRTGLLVCDPLVQAALRHRPTDRSVRTVQRRFLYATGLTHGAIVQIERARRAAALLRQGTPIADTIELAGYADQPHLTRALRRLVGQTPAQLFAPARALPMSILLPSELQD